MVIVSVDLSEEDKKECEKYYKYIKYNFKFPKEIRLLKIVEKKYFLKDLILYQSL